MTAPDPGIRLVSALYWDLVGLPPDPDLARDLAERMGRGLPVENVRAEILAMPEVQARTAAFSDAEVWDKGTWPIPFKLTTGTDARAILVSLPGMTTGWPTPPTPHNFVDDLPEVATLAIGMLAPVPQQAEQMRAWGLDAADVIRDSLQRLDLREDAAVLCGHSGYGTWAVLVGLTVGQGKILAGGPAIKMGTWIERLSAGIGHDPISGQVFDDAYRLSGVARRDQRLLLDELIPSLARSASGPLELVLYTAESDFMIEDTRELMDRARAWPRIRVSAIIGDYSGHNAMGDAFHSFARQYLLRQSHST